MQRKTRFKIALALAVALCLALVTVGYAVWTDPVTRLEIAKHVRNAWCGVNLPVWQILQEGSFKSVLWEDWPGNPRFAVYDPGSPGIDTDDLVLDKSTGLVWTRNVDIAGQTMTWISARDFCIKHAAGNVLGFSLPSVQQISTLFDAGGTLPPGTVGLWVNTPADPADGFWTSTPAGKEPDPLEIVDEGIAEVDSLDAWTYASSQSGAINGDFLYAPADLEDHTVTWRLGIDEAGVYDVYLFIPAGYDVGPLSTNAPVSVYGGLGGVVTIPVDLSINQGKWYHWGPNDFVAGNSAYVRLHNASDGAVVADAVKLVRPGTTPTWDTDGKGPGRTVYSIKNVFVDPGGPLHSPDGAYDLKTVWAVRGGVAAECPEEWS